MGAKNKLVFRVHVIQRMFQRNVSTADVQDVVDHGEIIREYADDTPYPSRLILGWRGKRPLHVVAADNDQDDETIIITVYEPDPAIWDADFKRKKQP